MLVPKPVFRYSVAHHAKERGTLVGEICRPFAGEAEAARTVTAGGRDAARLQPRHAARLGSREAHAEHVGLALDCQILGRRGWHSREGTSRCPSGAGHGTVAADFGLSCTSSSGRRVLPAFTMCAASLQQPMGSGLPGAASLLSHLNRGDGKNTAFDSNGPQKAYAGRTFHGS